jgi:ABC-type antimicrobial peptide transport system permease subunit
MDLHGSASMALALYAGRRWKGNRTLTFAGAALAIRAVAIVACAVPAFRAARVDPVVALRQE